MQHPHFPSVPKLGASLAVRDDEPHDHAEHVEQRTDRERNGASRQRSGGHARAEGADGEVVVQPEAQNGDQPEQHDDDVHRSEPRVLPAHRQAGIAAGVRGRGDRRHEQRGTWQRMRVAPELSKTRVRCRH